MLSEDSANGGAYGALISSGGNPDAKSGWLLASPLNLCTLHAGDAKEIFLQ